jgi:small-conductance mechanosensitive channel
MTALPLLRKLSAAFSLLLLAGCLFLVSAPILAADKAPAPEATLHYHFRPIFTFRATFVGVTPESRVRRALSRLDALPPGQMEKAIELTPFTVDGHRGINLHIGESVLFNILEGDLDPDEKASLDEVAKHAASALGAALQASSAQRRPLVLLKGVGLSVLATSIALALLWLIRRATAWMVNRFQQAIETHPESSTFRWARYGWLLVQRLAQLLMGFLWLSVAYLWLTFVLARFPLTEPLGDRLTDFLFGLLDTIGTSIVGAIPALTTAIVILFLTKAFNDALGNFFKAAKAGRVQVPGLHAETVNATHRIVNILVWGLGIAVAYPFIPMSDSDAFKGLSVMFGFMLTLGSAGIVNQLMSGLVLVYSRALSVGDFVDLGETVGVVSEVGALSTKIINMRNEEVTIPNAVSRRQPDQELLAAGWARAAPWCRPR